MSRSRPARSIEAVTQRSTDDLGQRFRRSGDEVLRRDAVARRACLVLEVEMAADRTNEVKHQPRLPGWSVEHRRRPSAALVRLLPEGRRAETGPDITSYYGSARAPPR